MKTLILLLLVSVSAQASVWLTNGIDPKDIDFFADVTGDGNSDAINWNRCYINLQNNQNPRFQEYSKLLCYTNGPGYFFFSPTRWKLGYFYGWDRYMATCIGDCVFTGIYMASYSFYGNDLTGNGYDDYILDHAGLAKIVLPDETSSTTNTVRDENGYLISMDDPRSIDYYIVDAGQHGGWDAVLNGLYSTTSRVYRILTPTNWVCMGLGKNVRCFGDWDGDGIEDFMYQDGEVVLGIIPEPFIRHILPIATVIFCRLKSCKTLF